MKAWREGGDNSITILDGFDVFVAFLEEYAKIRSEYAYDITGLLGSLDRNVRVNTAPLDMALWDDWLHAVTLANSKLDDVKDEYRKRLTEHHQLTRLLEIESLEARKQALDDFRTKTRAESWHGVGNVQITVVVAFDAMRHFLREYWNVENRSSKGIGFLVETLNADAPLDEPLHDETCWPLWLAKVDEVLRAKNISR